MPKRNEFQRLFVVILMEQSEWKRKLIGPISLSTPTHQPTHSVSQSLTHSLTRSLARSFTRPIKSLAQRRLEAYVGARCGRPFNVEYGELTHVVDESFP